ncbi:hypothetical protein GGX14DRAFT_382504 [Mycena pura]|uniref:Neutral/alkaline non-lysosomal ceramidase C-terminal domain-containing protein n=1 Tax=Mycena pura TaxID=153505 RepID=A0AAD6ULN2_9AGAR|nr:hypothetical protein GGX14DRAFT_382504 [Mycena pura]
MPTLCSTAVVQNILRVEESFLSVDQLVVEDGARWEAARSDSHPSTIYSWTRASTVRLFDVLLPVNPMQVAQLIFRCGR